MMINQQPILVELGCLKKYLVFMVCLNEITLYLQISFILYSNLVLKCIFYLFIVRLRILLLIRHFRVLQIQIVVFLDKL